MRVLYRNDPQNLLLKYEHSFDILIAARARCRGLTPETSGVPLLSFSPHVSLPFASPSAFLKPLRERKGGAMSETAKQEESRLDKL